MTRLPWLENLKANKPIIYDKLDTDVYITNAALASPVFDELDRTSLIVRIKLENNHLDGIPASFFKNRGDSVKIDVVLLAGHSYELKIDGRNDIDLWGYIQLPDEKKAEAPKPKAMTRTASTRTRNAKAKASTSAQIVEPATPVSGSAPSSRSDKRKKQTTLEEEREEPKKKVLKMR